MRAHGLHVLVHESTAGCGFGADCGLGDCCGLQIRVKGHLGVDGDGLVSGQANDHVGAAGSGIRLDRRLDVEIDMPREPGSLDDPAQLRLAPHAARAAGAEGAGEALGRGTQGLVGLLRSPQLLGDRAVLVLPFALKFGDRHLHRLQRLAHRLEGAEHRLLASLAFLASCLIRAGLGDEVAVPLLLLGELREGRLVCGGGCGKLLAHACQLRHRSRPGPRRTERPARDEACHEAPEDDSRHQ